MIAVGLDAQPFFDRFGFVVVDRKKPIIRHVELQNVLMRKELRDIRALIAADRVGLA